MTAVRARSDAGTSDSVVAGICHAWKAGDAIEFASYFAEDADLVNVHGMHVRGRQAIAGLYDMLFRSVFAGANLDYEVSCRRKLRPGLVLMHLRLEFQIVRGHLAGEHHVVTSMMLEQQRTGWAVVSLHNTKVDTPGA